MIEKKKATKIFYAPISSPFENQIVVAYLILQEVLEGVVPLLQQVHLVKDQGPHPQPAQVHGGQGPPHPQDQTHKARGQGQVHLLAQTNKDQGHRHQQDQMLRGQGQDLRQGRMLLDQGLAVDQDLDQVRY